MSGVANGTTSQDPITAHTPKCMTLLPNSKGDVCVPSAAMIAYHL